MQGLVIHDIIDKHTIFKSNIASKLKELEKLAKSKGLNVTLSIGPVKQAQRTKSKFEE